MEIVLSAAAAALAIEVLDDSVEQDSDCDDFVVEMMELGAILWARDDWLSTIWLSVCLSVCLCIFMSVCLYVCNVILEDCTDTACHAYVSCSCVTLILCVCLSVCMYVCMSVCLPVFLSVCPSVALSVCLFVCLSVCLSVGCPSVCLSVCLSVYHIYLSVSCVTPIPLSLPKLLSITLLVYRKFYLFWLIYSQYSSK